MFGPFHTVPMEMAEESGFMIATLIIIFGGAGDLTWRKLMPSLYALHRERRMPKSFAIIAVDRVPMRDVDLHNHLLGGVKRFGGNGNVKRTDWIDFVRHVTYQQGDFKDPVTYSNLKTQCALLEKQWKVKAGHIYHLATPPVMVGVIPKYLADA
jgi:glucose-6-phosphate 1-dehydrogenase